MLEEHIRELELRSEERLAEEQKRSRELLQRLEREKALEVENYQFRLQALEKEHQRALDEARALRAQLDRLKLEKRSAEDFLLEAQQGQAALREELARAQEAARREQDRHREEQADREHIIEELSKEVGWMVAK